MRFSDAHNQKIDRKNKTIYVSDSKTIEKIRKKLSRQRFAFETRDSKLISASFRIEQIKPQNFHIFSKFLDLLSFSSDLAEFNLQVSSYKLERSEFIEILRRMFSLNLKNVLNFSAASLPYTKEIMGYFTKFLITSYRHLTILDLDFPSNKFGDDGIAVFALGIVNMKSLNTLRLNFSNSKIKGTGLISLLTNTKTLKKLQVFELKCQNINQINENFRGNYLKMLKLIKGFSSLRKIKWDFSENHLGPECILKSIMLFQKNSYFDNVSEVSLNLRKNCHSKSWETFESLNQNLLTKKKYDKFLEVFEINLKSNSIGDSNFRHFYDIFVHFKGVKRVALDISDNKLRQFRSNFFFVFGSFGHNVSLEKIELDMTGNQGIVFQNFSINGDHIPILEKLTSLKIKTNLPNISKIETIFGNFLRKFPQVQNCQIFIPPSDVLQADGVLFLVSSFSSMKKLKNLSFELSCNFFREESYSEIIEKLKLLENLETLKIALRTNYNNPLRENFGRLLSLRDSCKRIMEIALVATKDDKKDLKFKQDLKFVGNYFLKENIFLKIEALDEISSVFLKKKSLMLTAILLKKQVKPILKRSLIIAEILELYI